MTDDDFVKLVSLPGAACHFFPKDWNEFVSDRVLISSPTTDYDKKVSNWEKIEAKQKALKESIECLWNEIKDEYFDLLGCLVGSNGYFEMIPDFVLSDPGIEIDSRMAVIAGGGQRYVNVRVCRREDTATLLKKFGKPPEVAKKEASGKGPGAPAKYDWDGVVKVLLTLANAPDGLPEKQRDLEDIIGDWFDSNMGDQPAISTIREKLGKWLPDD
jgi:hypothetical protein